MPTLEIFAMTIGGALAKSLLSTFLGDNWQRQVAHDLVDMLVGNASEHRRRVPSHSINEIADRIVKGMKPWIDTELRGMESAEKTDVIATAAKVIASAQITADKLIELGLDPRSLGTELKLSDPHATQDFTKHGQALYFRILDECARGIMDDADKMDGFGVAAVKHDIEEREATRALVVDIVEKPSREDRDFEEKYCKAIVDSLDRLEMFGLDRYDDVGKRQRLTIAYVPVEMELSNLAISGSILSSWVCANATIANRHQDTREAIEKVIANGIIWYTSPSAGLLEERTWSGKNSFAHDRSKTSVGFRIDDHSPFFLSGMNRRESKDVPGRNLLTIQDVGHKILITGRAGSGKTTLLKWIAVQYARAWQQASSRAKPVPFYLRLRDYAGTSFPPPEDFVRKVLPMLAGSMPSGWVHRILESGRALVLIDGLDEVPLGERTAMLESVEALTNSFQSSWYFISSRPFAIEPERWPAWEQWAKANNLITFSVKEMAPSQVSSLIDQWHKALAATTDDLEEQQWILSLPRSLKRQLADRPELRRLAVNPLLCAMICTVYHGQREKLPYERASLYLQCVNILLNRRDPVRNVPLTDYPQLSDTEKLEIVQSLAYWYLKNGYSSAPIDEVDRFVGNLLTTMRANAVSVDGVRRLLVERSDLLREPVSGYVDFVHRTFLEFLAAKEAVAEADFGLLRENLLNDQWRETIVMAVGEMRPVEADEFLREVLKRANTTENETHRQQLIMLAAASLETVVRLAPKLRLSIQEHAASLIPPQTRDFAGELAKGGPNMVQYLLPNPDYSSEESANCIRALAQIGGQSALDAITQFASDQRYLVCNEIGMAWDAFDREEFVNAVLTKMPNLILSTLPNTAEIELMTALTELELVGKMVDDLEALSKATSLERLYLERCQVSNYRPIESLQNLRWLTLRLDDAIKTKPTWAAWPRLENLAIRGNPSSDFRWTVGELSELSSLKQLNLERFGGDLTLDGIEKLSRLKWLGTTWKSMSVISDTSVLRHLSGLRLVSEPGNSPEPWILAGLPNLSELTISTVGTEFLNGLAEVSSLKTLKLLGCTVEGLSPSLFQHIRKLELAACDGVRPELFSMCSNLHSLVISGDEIDQPLITAISDVPTLKMLEIGLPSPKSLSVSALANANNLQELRVSSNLAQDLKPIADLPLLRTVGILGSGRIDRASLAHRDDVKIVRY